jgi:hypothetical protein
MLLVGFGFLMVFVKRYGYGATTGTYILVAVGLPLYLGLRATGLLSAEAVLIHTMRGLLLAEFAVVSALIAMGAVLGRVRLYQYALLAGIAGTVAVALTGGLVSGLILRATGAKQKAYEDNEEFDVIP